MNKREQAKFEKLLATLAKVNGTSVDSMKEEVDYNSLVTEEDSFYEGQAVYNFFKARVSPRLEPKEAPEDFDRRYREWRMKQCEECGETFAYALNYDGVKFCSITCLDAALKKIGLQVTRGRDLKKRWGAFFHPAIVPASAFAVLQAAYGDAFPESFDPSQRDLPKHLFHEIRKRRKHTDESLDNLSSIA